MNFEWAHSKLNLSLSGNEVSCPQVMDTISLTIDFEKIYIFLIQTNKYTSCWCKYHFCWQSKPCIEFNRTFDETSGSCYGKSISSLHWCISAEHQQQQWKSMRPNDWDCREKKTSGMKSWQFKCMRGFFSVLLSRECSTPATPVLRIQSIVLYEEQQQAIKPNSLCTATCFCRSLFFPSLLLSTSLAHTY